MEDNMKVGDRVTLRNAFRRNMAGRAQGVVLAFYETPDGHTNAVVNLDDSVRVERNNGDYFFLNTLAYPASLLRVEPIMSDTRTLTLDRAQLATLYAILSRTSIKSVRGWLERVETEITADLGREAYDEAHERNRPAEDITNDLWSELRSLMADIGHPPGAQQAQAHVGR